mmetsp:Transcript_13379/g.29066  ORF Transcript_13379/g.29066 Transcript_13379/m.29066 type:complete len:95 (+) Transcript_13379:86-370(+)
MGKKSKRTRQDDNIVSDSDISNQDHGTAATTAPGLRTVAEGQNAEIETADNLQCEDPYEDIYEEEDDDGSYEDVYESSGDEDEEYMEAMATGDA